MKTNSPPVITVIGAASTTFGPKILRDMINHPDLDGSALRLVDVHSGRLEIYDRLAKRIEQRVSHRVTISSTSDRREALPGSDYVILSVDRGHYQTWKQDFEIPRNHGIRQVMGELGGPGGLFHSLRQIPLHLEIARDIESLCPNAIVMVCSNPLNRICLAMHRYSQVGEIIGLCHGVEMALYLFLQHHLPLSGDEMEVTAAGTNHMTWILDIRHRETGQDLYPLIRETLANLSPDKQPLSRKLLEVFGYLPGTLDDHTGEYLCFAHEYVSPEGPNFGHNLSQEEKRWEFLDALSRDEAQWDEYEKRHGSQEASSEELRLDEFFRPRSWADTLAYPIINAVAAHKRHRMPAVNMINDGTISNLPADVFVESPAIVDASGVHPIRIGALPGPLAAYNRRDIDQMFLTVEAAVHGHRRLVLQAMMLDPVVDSVQAAERIIDDMLEAQRDYLPAFH